MCLNRSPCNIIPPYHLLTTSITFLISFISLIHFCWIKLLTIISSRCAKRPPAASSPSSSLSFNISKEITGIYLALKCHFRRCARQQCCAWLSQSSYCVPLATSRQLELPPSNGLLLRV